MELDGASKGKVSRIRTTIKEKETAVGDGVDRNGEARVCFRF